MGRTIRLHDTLTGRVLPVEPRSGNRIGIYACGPTVYGRIHVGNARPFVVFSLMARVFAHEGYNVTFVTNITDVNDKIYAAAQTSGMVQAVAKTQSLWLSILTNTLPSGTESTRMELSAAPTASRLPSGSNDPP